MNVLVTTFKYVWVLPNTLLGLCFALGGNARIVSGIIEIQNPLTRFFLNHVGLCKNAAAMTLGHVVIAQDQNSLEYTRDHERVHVRQYESFGPFFIPIYFWLSFHAWRTGQDAYRGNLFEVEAYDHNQKTK